MTSLRVGLVQSTTSADPGRNARALAAALADLALRGTRLAFTPEMSGMVAGREMLLASARTEADDPVLAAAQETASRRRMWVQLGSLALRPEPGADRLVNRAFLLDDTGAIRARYDKMHLFDVDAGDGRVYRESQTFVPGASATAAETPWGMLGLAICYDLRFPALFAGLARAGATMFAVPAAFTRPTGRAHWHVLLRARAIETGAFVIATAQTGSHEDGRATYGHSLVVNPWGEVLLDMGEVPGVATCDVDLDAVAATRARIPALEHARAVVLA